jgi:hypothetical protein
MGSIHEKKTRGQKSPATVPLNIFYKLFLHSAKDMMRQIPYNFTGSFFFSRKTLYASMHSVETPHATSNVP